MAGRGVLYMVWGGEAEEAAVRSIASVKRFHPDMKFEVIHVPAKPDPFMNLLEKAKMMSLSPFDETLFLDADTIVLGNLDYGFERAAQFGVACCISEAPQARRYPALPQNDAIEYNTGVLFFSRARASDLFRRWEELTPHIDSRLPFLREGERGEQLYNDQAAFAVAAAEWDRHPFVLPYNWNFRPRFHWTFFGPIKIWHDYSAVPDGILRINESYDQPGTIIRFHGRMQQQS